MAESVDLHPEKRIGHARFRAQQHKDVPVGIESRAVQWMPQRPVESHNFMGVTKVLQLLDELFGS